MSATPRGLRVDRVPSKPVQREPDGQYAIHLWLQRDGRFDGDLALRLSPAEAESLHAQLATPSTTSRSAPPPTTHRTAARRHEAAKGCTGRNRQRRHHRTAQICLPNASASPGECPAWMNRNTMSSVSVSSTRGHAQPPGPDAELFRPPPTASPPACLPLRMPDFGIDTSEGRTLRARA